MKTKFTKGENEVIDCTTEKGKTNLIQFQVHSKEGERYFSAKHLADFHAYDFYRVGPEETKANAYLFAGAANLFEKAEELLESYSLPISAGKEFIDAADRLREALRGCLLPENRK